MNGRIARQDVGIKKVVLPRVGLIKIGKKEMGRNGKE